MQAAARRAILTEVADVANRFGLANKGKAGSLMAVEAHAH